MFDYRHLITDSTSMDVCVPKGVRRGYVERDFKKYPRTMFAPPSQLQLIPRSEWDARIQEQTDLKSSIKDIRNKADGGGMMQCLDQNGKGYCWAHSTTHTVMLSNAVANNRFVPLSAYAVACKIKNFRDEGGWCGLSAEFARKNGIPSQAKWPQQSMNRSNDNADTWADAAKHVITEDWVDLTVDVYDQNLTFDQVATCLLCNIPVAVDFNWWSHSVCAIRLVRVEAGSYGLEILNSWGMSYGDNGTAVLQGSRATPDGAIATRVVTPGA